MTRFILGLGALATGLLLCVPNSAQADDFYWVGPTGFPHDYGWNTGSNWDRGSVPGEDDRAHVANGSRAYLGILGGGSSAHVEQLYIGEAGYDGEVVQGFSARMTIDDSLWLGAGSGTGTYWMSGLGLTADHLHIGESTGNNLFVQGGGFVHVDGVHVGSAGTGSFGTYEMRGGTLARGFWIPPSGSVKLEIADSGGANVTGIFTQTGGRVFLRELELGGNAGTTGAAIYDLLGGTLSIDPLPPFGTPFDFNSTSPSVYFNFDFGGRLILKGDWDLSRLAGVPNADFRVQGAPASEMNLGFQPGTGDLDGFTIIFAIPEPSTFLIWCLLAALGIGTAWRRRR